MANAAIVVLADTESHADLGRVTNALQAAREFEQEEGDDVRVIFDGAGTKWVTELTEEDHPAHDLYVALEDEIEVCDYCAGAFEVEEAVEESGAEAVSEFEGHPSIRDLVAEDYEIITY